MNTCQLTVITRSSDCIRNKLQQTHVSVSIERMLFSGTVHLETVLLAHLNYIYVKWNKMSEAPDFLLDLKIQKSTLEIIDTSSTMQMKMRREEDESVSVSLKTSKLFTDHCEGELIHCLKQGRFFFPHIEFRWKFLNWKNGLCFISNTIDSIVLQEDN